MEAKSLLFNPNYNCCELGAWVRPSVVHYDKTFLLWSRRRAMVHNESLTAYLLAFAQGKERDAALQLTLNRMATTKMINQLKLHPTWVADVRIGSISVAMQVGPVEKRAMRLSGKMETSFRPKNWTWRSTSTPLKRVQGVSGFAALTEVGWSPFVRKWILRRSCEQLPVG